MHDDHDRPIVPQCIRVSDEYKSLEAEGRAALAGRLEALELVGTSLADGSRFASAQDFYRFSEGLELDLAVIQEIATATSGGLSRWLIHHSWTFNAPPCQMTTALSQSLLSALDNEEPSVFSSISAFISSFKQYGEQLVSLLRSFRNSVTFHEAIGIHIAIDIVANRLLLVCYKLRLNSELDQ